jgi:hypothetical protein
MDFTPNDKIIAGLDRELSSLRRELEDDSADPPASIDRFHGTPATTAHRLTNWRHVAFFGSLVAAFIGIAIWWWSPSAHSTMTAASASVPLTQPATKDGAPIAPALSSDLAQQLQTMTRDLAALRQAVEQLNQRQEQFVRDNDNVTNQLKASHEEIARNNSAVDQIKETQILMARESQALTDRLNGSEKQPARVVANAEPTVTNEEPTVSAEEPKVMPEIPLPRPRQPAAVAQMLRPAPTSVRAQAQKPQPSLAWPWSTR